MDNRKMFREISRLRTSDLLIAKMAATRRIALFNSLKLGFLGLLGVFVGQIVKAVFSVQAVHPIDVFAAVFAVCSVVMYMLFDGLEAASSAQKELICELLAIRSSKAS